MLIQKYHENIWNHRCPENRVQYIQFWYICYCFIRIVHVICWRSTPTRDARDSSPACDVADINHVSSCCASGMVTKNI